MATAPTPWICEAAPDEALVAEIAQRFELSPLLANLVARRVSSADEAEVWLHPEKAPLCDPFAFKGMREVVDRILQALRNHEAITVFGDYDADGITGTALLVRGLRSLGANVKPFIPDREKEGYGLTPAAIARCLSYPPRPSLLITVDCGISCVDEVALLRNEGIDVLITDHHTPPAILPEALATVNPRLSAPKGAENLCGCAVAFTVLRALEAEGLPVKTDLLRDVVAVATIADVMLLQGDNRTLVAQGLRVLERGEGNQGLFALAEAQNILGETLTAENIAFRISPCINAAGRLGQHGKAYLLFDADCSASAKLRSPTQHAKALMLLNDQRRTIEHDLLAQILATKPAISPNGHLCIVGGEDFHSGVIGIVAAQVMDVVGAPVAIVSRTPDGGGHGSMRACGDWNAVEALNSVSDLLDHYGGHAAAAGFSLLPGTWEAFCERLPKAFPPPGEPEPNVYQLDLDGVPIAMDLCYDLRRLEPYGNGNPKPIFCKTVVLESYRVVGSDQRHVQLMVRPIEGGNAQKAIWFGGAARVTPWPYGLHLRLYFTLGIETFNGSRPQIQIVDAQPLPRA